MKRNDCSWLSELAKQYRTVKLPSKMLEAIELLIKDHPEWGYSSIADFVKDAVRLHYSWRIHRLKFEKNNCAPRFPLTHT